MARIEATGISVRRGGAEVLKGIDAVVSGGEVVGLIGPNGSGKTTLLLALAGLVPRTAGSVLVDGEPLETLGPDRRARRIAYLEQAPAAQWPITVERVVALGRIPHRSPLGPETGADRAAVDRALDRCDLGPLAARRVSELSGGERARVMLARALAGEPAILLADEPVSELDPFHQLQVMERLRAEAAAGMAVVVVLHDLSLAMRFCDRVCLLDRGTVAASGTAEAVIGSDAAERVFAVSLLRGPGWAVPWRRREGWEEQR
jgi:iron complex transport system ATP-binding protein